MSLLDDLLPTTDSEALCTASWPTRYVLRHGPFERLPAWLRTPWLGDVVALRRNVPTELYLTHPGAVRIVRLPPMAETDAAELLLRYGLTLTFPDVSAFVPGARPWLDALADELGLPRAQVEVSLFVSAPGNGLSCHFDPYDVLVVQLSGSKTWRVGRAPAVVDPVGRQYAPGTRPSLAHAAEMPDALPERDPLDLVEIELQPGSVLFIPRGTWHQTAGSSGTSVSASVILSAPSVGEVLVEQLGRLIAQDVRLRRPALGFAGDVTQRAHAAAQFDQAVAALRESVARLSAQAAFESSAAPERVAEVIAPTSRFVRDPSLRLAFERAVTQETDDGPAVRLDVVRSDRAFTPGAATPDYLETPADGLDLLRWLDARRGVFCAADVAAAFDAYDFESVAGVLAEFVATDLLVVVPFAAPGAG